MSHASVGVFDGECGRCGRQIDRHLPRDQNGGNNQGIWYKCPGCAKHTWLKFDSQRDSGMNL